MQPVYTKNTNTKFIADGCGNLPATVKETPEGRVIETCWKLTPEEMDKVMKSGVIFIQQWGIVPPMNVEARSMCDPKPVSPPFNFVGEAPVEMGCPFD